MLSFCPTPKKASYRFLGESSPVNKDALHVRVYGDDSARPAFFRSAFRLSQVPPPPPTLVLQATNECEKALIQGYMNAVSSLIDTGSAC